MDSQKDKKTLSVDEAKVLRRSAKELDNFLTLLAQVEEAISQLIELTNARIPSAAARSIQSIDYISQASVGLSSVLSAIGSHDQCINETMKQLKPRDLAGRLMDQPQNDTGKSSVLF